MSKKVVTLLVVTNYKGQAKKITFPLAWFKASVVLLLLATVVFSATLSDYVGLLFEAHENKRLKVENDQLKAQYKVVEGKVQALEEGLDRIQNFSTKLRLITDSRSSKNNILKLSVNADPQKERFLASLSEPIEKRESIDSLIKEDAVFFDKPPLDLSKGELAIAGEKNYGSLSIRIEKGLSSVRLQEQSVVDLWGSLKEKQSLLLATPSLKPVGGWTTSKFGLRIHPVSRRLAMHNGVDIGAAHGSPVHSPAEGIVIFSGYDAGYGKLVAIDHGYGITTRYGHNSRVFVNVGQKVKRNEVIAAVGNTGRSTGSHLHYEVRINDMPVNPDNFILHE